jgi:hypothetical protein
MKKNILYLSTILIGWPTYISAQDSLEFTGPDNAPIYVMEGDFKQSGSISVQGQNWDFSSEVQATMDVNSGSLALAGQIDTQGYSNQYLINMGMSLAAKGISKQAGNTVRWSAKAAMSGPFTIRSGGFITESGFLRGIYQYRNMTLDDITGEQTGTVSYKASLTNNYGYRFPISQPPTLTTLPRPTIYTSEGEWRAVAGDWSAAIEADVYPSGKINGSGELVVGDTEDPYANVEQNIKGKLNPKSGVATLNGAGATKATSRVKITLNYVDSSGETLPGKSSVSAYAQKRKF